ncbi:MAG: NAD-binding protein, partial [Thiobacillus sp.]
EFSIIFVAMGISLDHVGTEALGLTTLVGITTIALSTYMILYSHPLYEKLAPWLGWFERRRPFRELAVATERHDLKEADVIVFGLGRYGARLALGLKDAGLKVLGVEFDPEVARAMRRQGLVVRYGDGVAAEFIESLPLAQTSWIISTLPDLASNRSLLQALREHRYPGEVAIVAREDFEGVALKHLGAPTILYPMRNAVDYAVEALTELIRPKENRQ